MYHFGLKIYSEIVKSHFINFRSHTANLPYVHVDEKTDRETDLRAASTNVQNVIIRSVRFDTKRSTRHCQYSRQVNATDIAHSPISAIAVLLTFQQLYKVVVYGICFPVIVYLEASVMDAYVLFPVMQVPVWYRPLGGGELEQWPPPCCKEKDDHLSK
jgi:hypothetical protein